MPIYDKTELARRAKELSVVRDVAATRENGWRRLTNL